MERGHYAMEWIDSTNEDIATVIDMGKTACKVPFAPEYIDKVKKRGSIGKKRKSDRC